MLKKTILLGFALTTSLSAHFIGNIEQEGLIELFPYDTRNKSNQLSLASPSAILFDGSGYILGVDKKIYRNGAGHSAARINLEANSVDLPNNELLQSTRKYESATKTLDHQYGFLATGFSSLKGKERLPTKAKQATFIRLMCFPLHNPEQAQVVDPTDFYGAPASWDLMVELKETLGGTALINAEGLTVIPGNRLLFGVRAQGQDYKNDYTVFKMVSVSFTIEEGICRLGSDYRLDYEFDVTTVPGIRHDVGISSLEYDPFNNQLVILSAYESTGNQGSEGMGTYMWTLSIDNFKSNRPPELVCDLTGEPLNLNHKMEGLDIIGPNRYITIADDDYIYDDSRREVSNSKTEFSRLHNEAAYAIIQLYGGSDFASIPIRPNKDFGF